jgi:hypothetical protein
MYNATQLYYYLYSRLVCPSLQSPNFLARTSLRLPGRVSLETGSTRHLFPAADLADLPLTFPRRE